jgi:stage II sporulation protein AA (anti-sigma F factor antagonist)
MFEIRVAPDGQVVVSGRLDAAESDRALQVFRGLSRPTTVDCSGLDYISSAGIAVIMDAYKRLSVGGHAFKLVNVTPRVKNVFVYAGLDKLLGIS